MKKTLLDRFQGCLIGNLIAEQLIHSPSIFQPNSFDKIHFSSWSQLQWQIIEDLINHQGAYFSKETEYKLIDLEQLENSSKLALATLPLNLYCHESLSFWQQQLNHIFPEDQNLSNLQSVKLDLIIFAKALSLIFKEIIKPQFFLDQLLEEIINLETSLTEKLVIINQQKKIHKSSTEISKIVQQYPQPENTPLAMAIYYFSDTIENIEISLNRAKNTTIEPLLTTTLTGSLSGLYHGWNQLPLKWRVKFKQQSLYTNCDSLTQQLFSLWCGVSNPQNILINPSIPVASISVIQKRLIL